MYTPPNPNLQPVPPHGIEVRLALANLAPTQRRVAALPGDDPKSVRTARRTVRYQLASWNICDDVADDLVTVASELVTNAFAHAVARPRVRNMQVWVVIGRHPGGVMVATVDNGVYVPERIRPLPPGAEASHGRGLHVVARLSDRWGHTAHPQGTAVWAARDLPASRIPALRDGAADRDAR